jgi:hypothetical protein
MLGEGLGGLRLVTFRLGSNEQVRRARIPDSVTIFGLLLVLNVILAINSAMMVAGKLEKRVTMRHRRAAGAGNRRHHESKDEQQGEEPTSGQL